MLTEPDLDTLLLRTQVHHVYIEVDYAHPRFEYSAKNAIKQVAIWANGPFSGIMEIAAVCSLYHVLYTTVIQIIYIVNEGKGKYLWHGLHAYSMGWGP